ncbi:MAG: hypothetical protein NZ529_04245 [Cytophagaceae bacterium]|nr:hypothetical protein [Cytophagaceae bacterium]MDW8455984.1 hypothetical protein [Cytophagaceae bacterium]
MNTKFFYYFKLIMGIAYIVLGITFIGTRDALAAKLDPTTSIILGALMIVYGAFRVYRTYITDRKKSNT